MLELKLIQKLVFFSPLLFSPLIVIFTDDSRVILTFLLSFIQPSLISSQSSPVLSKYRDSLSSKAVSCPYHPPSLRFSPQCAHHDIRSSSAPLAPPRAPAEMRQPARNPERQFGCSHRERHAGLHGLPEEFTPRSSGVSS